MFKRLGVILVSLILSLAPASFLALPLAYAQGGCVLFGAQGAEQVSNLLVLNPATGAVSSSIGPIGYAVTGLAADPISGVLYGVTSRLDPRSPGRLIRIDRTTGAGTVVGDLRPTTEAAADVTFRADGTLFGWLEPTSDDLVRINTTTGAATIVGNSGLSTFGSGLAFSPSGTLYFAGSGTAGQLRTVNPSTGLTTVVATLTGAPLGTDSIAALAFDPGGALFGVALDSAGVNRAFLVTINTSTGVVTSRGQSVNRLDAIVFDCVGANDPNNDDREDEVTHRPQTRNNATRGDDESRTEGNVVGVRCVASDPVPTLASGYIVEPDMLPYALIANRDEGAQKILMIKEAAKLCQHVRVGDYLEAEGEKQSEALFYADDVTIKRR